MSAKWSYTTSGRTHWCHSSSILHVVLTTDPDMIDSLVVADSRIPTDHMAITFEVLCTVDQVDFNSRGYNFWKGGYEAIEANLLLVDWQLFFRSCLNANILLQLLLRLREHAQSLSEHILKDPSPEFQTRLRRDPTRLTILEESELRFINS